VNLTCYTNGHKLRAEDAIGGIFTRIWMSILQLASCDALLGRNKVRLDATDLFDSADTRIVRDEISENPTNL